MIRTIKKIINILIVLLKFKNLKEGFTFKIVCLVRLSR
jgi:hypothetical protein